MTSSPKRRLLSAALTIALAGATGAALAQDKETVVKDRQALMKEQGKDIGAVKAYLDGKADQAAAEAGATGLTQTTRKIPAAFPPGTNAPSPAGKYAPKPEIWTDWDKFLGAQKQAAAKADALLAAVKGGSKDAIRTAFADLGKNGCGNCHTNFRETIKN